jgi:hypothetical protein
MHSQPAVIFKRKGSTFAFMGIFALLTAVFGFLCLYRQTPVLTVVGTGMITLALALFYRVWRIFARPYLHLTDNQVTVYRGVFSTPVHYSLMDIHSAHTNHPETYIELIGRNPSDPVRIDLHPLDRADRIRFIFLVESSINRKFSHNHSPAVQAMV